MFYTAISLYLLYTAPLVRLYMVNGKVDISHADYFTQYGFPLTQGIMGIILVVGLGLFCYLLYTVLQNKEIR